MLTDAELLNKAINYAVDMHNGQQRKTTPLPYIVHPMEVAAILSQMTTNLKLIAAGILHDVLEDTAATEREVESMFGADVLKLVLFNTEDGHRHGAKGVSWEERKRHTINKVADASFEEQALVCADKLSNLRSTYADWRKVGDEVWKRFNRGRDDQKWYYYELIKSFNKLENTPAYDELKRIFEEIFREEG